MTVELGQVCADSARTSPAPTNYRSSKPFDVDALPPFVSAQEAFDIVLSAADATLPARDAVDQRLVQEVIDGAGGIPERTPDIPEYHGGTPYADEDHDGIDDTWESVHGLDPTNASDGQADADGDKYTNLEDFLNGTNPRGRDENQAQ